MKPYALALWLAVVPVAAAAQEPPAQDQPPKTTFRSTVDLVPVDVNVVDRTGRPVADLTAGDFGLTVDGKPRKIASAQFIAVSRATEPAEPAPSNFSSNAAAIGGRLIMIVVDQGNIGTARGKYATDAASRFIGRLSPSDRVGLYTIPGAGTQIDFTANHALIQTMLQKIVGRATSDTESHKVGLSEALALERGDQQVDAQLVDRECGGARIAEEVTACHNQLVYSAHILFAETRSRTRDSLLSLRHLMERLAQSPTPKTVVFVSEGLLIDREVSDVAWVGPTAAHGQVTLYVLQLEPPQFDTQGMRPSPSRSADIDLAQEGLGLLAGLARGSVFRVANRADAIFDRLALELSGYYLLSFEPEPGDKDGKTHKIRIDVPGRKSIEIRSRREFSMNSARARTDEEVLADTLRSPLLASELPLKLSTYTLKDPDSQKLRVLFASEIDRSLNPDGTVALAYVLTDAKGAAISSQVETDVQSALRPNRTQTYFGAIAVDPGVYTLKMAVVDSAGKRGSVEYTFRAQLTAASQIRVTDLLIAEAGPSGNSGLTPAVAADFTGDTLQGYFELYSDAADVLRNATAVIEVAANEQGPALDSAAARFQADGGVARRVAEATVPIAVLPPGNYVARAVISSGGRKVGQVTRPFRIVRSAPSVTAPGSEARRAPGAAAPIAFASRMDRFEPASVLAPPVVGFFLNRMNVGNRIGNAPPAAIEAARAGNFEAAIEAMKGPGTTQLATVFVSGLGLYAKGQLDAAAVKFRESLQLDSEFFPAAFYLGACYAAGGRDRDAAGAWQTALITESDAPFIYTLLGDALLRLHDNDQAVDILLEASHLWPETDDVLMRLGAAQAAAGKPAEAIATLDGYLARHPDDHATLLLALKTIYESRSAGKSIGTGAEDRQRFDRYAAAYAAAKGPQQTLVDLWKRFMDR